MQSKTTNSIIRPEKINNQDFIKFKNFSSSNYTVKKMKIQVTDWMKYSAKHTSNKELVSTIY